MAKRRNNLVSPFMLLLTILSAILLSFLIIKTLFPFLSNDLKRNKLIIETCQTYDNQKPLFAVLGSSVVLAGINCNTVQHNLKTNYEVLNLASADQQLEESLLLTSCLPENTNTILLGIMANHLFIPVSSLSQSKISAYYSYGLDFSDKTKELVKNSGNELLLQQLYQSDFKNTLNSRWIFRSSIDSWIRNLLRKDIDFNTGFKDLKYPNIYSGNIGDESIIQKAKSRILDIKSDKVDISVLKTLRTLKSYSDKNNIKFIVAIMPNNPLVKDIIGVRIQTEFSNIVKNIRENENIQVFDFHDTIEEKYFFDEVHLNHDGGNLFTGILVDSLKAIEFDVFE